MHRISLRISIRSLMRRKFYTLLNVLGLAVGFLAFTMIILYVNDELSYDKFHKEKDRVYRIWDETSTRQVAIIPYIWSRFMKEEFPEVENYTNLVQIGIIVKRGAALFNEPNAFAVDSTFFKVFDYPILKGDPEHMVDGTHQVVLTPESAEKYFGSTDPMGELLEINLFGHTESFEVTGVVESPPNSHLQFDFLLPFPLVKRYSFNPGAYENWALHFAYSYLLMADETDIPAVEARFDDFLFKHGGESLRDAYDVGLELLPSIYLESDLEFDLTPRGSKDYVNILTVVALVILGIAIINFVNLSTAQSLKRAKEVSVRKIFGSEKSSLLTQFLIESIMVSALAMITSLLLLGLVLPAFNGFTGKAFTLVDIYTPVNLFLALIITVVTGVAAGLYPAFVISSFQPIKVLYAKAAVSGKSALARRILVIFQFSMTVILLIGTGIIHYQVEYMRTKDLGFNQEQVLNISDAGRVSSDMNLVRRLRQELQKVGVLSVSASSNPPGIQSWSTRYVPDGWSDDEEENISLSTIFADHEYLKTFEVEFHAGRDFDRNITSDSSSGFLINQAAQELFASYDPSWLEDPIGKRLDWSWKNKPGNVVGVFKDFHFESVHRNINPLIIHVWPEYFFSIQIRISTEQANETIAGIESVWNRLFPNIPFEYQFVDQAYEDHVAADKQLGNLFMVFSSLSIIVAILGLFGLSSFMAQEKAREMSIRKVIGATEGQLAYLLTSKFISLVLLANLIALPAGYILMNQWLDDFANRIGMPIGVFIATTILTVMVSLLTTSYHALKTSRSNPVNVLGRE